jgi:hypothetical protein
MPRIRALMNSSDHKAGDEWDASDEHARILCTPDVLGGQRAEYVDRAMRAIEPEQPKRPTTPEAEKRRYMRRDLRAQS